MVSEAFDDHSNGDLVIHLGSSQLLKTPLELVKRNVSKREHLLELGDELGLTGVDNSLHMETLRVHLHELELPLPLLQLRSIGDFGLLEFGYNDLFALLVLDLGVVPSFIVILD